MVQKVEGKVLEGSELGNLLKSAKQTTFVQNACTVFVPEVTKELQFVDHLDVVSDTYRRPSLVSSNWFGCIVCNTCKLFSI